jgi:hypothetical protein
VGLSLVAFDTDHIKGYVFRTDKLKEIRGASSLLDYLNRIVMPDIAEKYHYDAHTVYSHGGAGLFSIATEKADAFGKQVQQEYHAMTGGGASITFATLSLPDRITRENIHREDLTGFIKILQWRLQEAKLHPPASLALASHPFIRLCDACGSEYADAEIALEELFRNLDETDERYCTSCQCKRKQEDIVDNRVKQLIRLATSVNTPVSVNNNFPRNEYMWTTIIERLDKLGYDMPEKMERPNDFNVFHNFKGSKDYFGLIYADGNNMGHAFAHCKTLDEHKALAHTIDDALYTAVCTAIVRHLKIADHLKPKEQQTGELENPVFPFDILLLGGDDICMLVPASVALDTALTLAETFRNEMEQKQHKLTLSVGVVLAPIKYPFGLLQETASTALKFAKKKGSDARVNAEKAEKSVDDTRINFFIVTGGSSSDFKAVHEAVYHQQNDTTTQDFYATLRPYAPSDLHALLNAIRSKDGANLGRTKLHQMREVILQMNLTTSVGDALAVLMNWREKQRNHVVHNVYEFAARYQIPRSDPEDPVSGFPRVTFPWFFDGKVTKKVKKQLKEFDTYRTPLLDFTELYDFVSREGGDSSDEE